MASKFVKTFKKSIPKGSVPVLTIVIVAVAFLIAQGKPPHFFDVFGIGVFTFLTILGVWMLGTKRETSDLVATILLFIGIIGLGVDLIIVIRHYLL